MPDETKKQKGKERKLIGGGFYSPGLFLNSKAKLQFNTDVPNAKRVVKFCEGL